MSAGILRRVSTGLQSPLQLAAAGATHVGLRRQHNEDSVLIREDLGLFLVADGAGGHHAGDVASALAARSISNYVGATRRATWDKPEHDAAGLASGARQLAAAVLKANHDVLEVSRSSTQHRGMGTTVVAVSHSPRSRLLHVVHAGDSRCYRLRAGRLEQLTLDHCVINDVLAQKPDLSDEVLAKLPRHAVTRALGMTDALRLSVRSYELAAEDRYLLCSDGLSGPVPASQLERLLVEQPEREACVRALTLAALEAGGPDNITALVLDVLGQPPTASERSLPTLRDDYEEPELLLLGIEELELEELLRRSPLATLPGLGEGDDSP